MNESQNDFQPARWDVFGLSPPWDDPKRSAVEAYVPEWTNFLAAWPRIYSGVLPPGLWRPSDGSAPQVQTFNSAKHWGVASIPSRASREQMRESSYLPTIPRAPDWDAIPPSGIVGAAQLFPEPPSSWSWSEPAGYPDPTQSRRSDDGTQPISPVLSDVTPDNYWIPGADYAAEHHEFPQAHYTRMPPETRRVFDRATVGQLFLSLEGRRHEYDTFHREYNAATGELLKRFMQEHNIAQPEQMTPDHARAVLQAIAESEDPHIRYYREFIRRLRMFYRLRIGRGTE